MTVTLEQPKHAASSATNKMCIDGLYYFIMCFRNAMGMPHLQTQTNVLRIRDDILHLLLAAPQLLALQPHLSHMQQCKPAASAR